MITKNEILKGNKLPQEFEANFDVLYWKSNLLRRAYDKPMIVTSGFRSLEDHKRIYELKGVTSPPMGSAHLKCEAIDILDKDKQLKNWILNNIDYIISLGFYVEDPCWTPDWVHLQISPPKSGKRFFIP